MRSWFFCASGDLAYKQIFPSMLYSLTLWKRAELRRLKPAQLDGEQLSPEQILEKIRQLQKDNEYLKRQREILKKL